MANKALLVGINKYKIPGADLNGCVNDVMSCLQDAGIIRHLQMPILEAVTMAPLHIIFANIPEKRRVLLPEANCSRGCVPL